MNAIAPCDVRAGARGMADQYRNLLAEHRRPLCQVCQNCGRAQFPPKLLCPRCSSAELEWCDVGGNGTVQSWVSVHTSEGTAGFAVPPFLRDAVPYSSVFAQPDVLAETLRLPSLMTGVDPAVLKVGTRVVLEVGGDDRHPVVISRLA